LAAGLVVALSAGLGAETAAAGGDGFAASEAGGFAAPAVPRGASLLLSPSALGGAGGGALVGSSPGCTTVGGRTDAARSTLPSSAVFSADALESRRLADAPRSLRTPRPTSTPHRKMTTDTTVAAMNTNTSCLPFSWISWNPSSCA